MSINTQVVLTCFIYLIGMSWTLIGVIIWADDNKSTKTEETIKLLLFWPLTWTVVIVFGFLIAYEWVGEWVQDLTDYFRFWWRYRNR